MPLAAGYRLGHYEMLALIGAGGMGEVYKARDNRLDLIVAVKILRDGHGERFRQEVRAIAALNHPHICVLHDVGPNYLVMEYIGGYPPCPSKLQALLPLEDCLRIATQIAGALEAAHERGVIHRDLKPATSW